MRKSANSLHEHLTSECHDGVKKEGCIMKKFVAMLLVCTMVLGLGFTPQAHDHGQVATHDHDHGHNHGHVENYIGENNIATRMFSSLLNPITRASAEEVESVSGRNIVLLLNNASGSMMSRNGMEAVTVSEQGMRLVAGDVVTAGEDGSIFFQVDDDKLFEVEQGSSVVISEASNNSLVLSLAYGGMYFYVKNKLGENEHMVMNAGSTTMSVRGTSGYICWMDYEAWLLVVDGLVETTHTGKNGSNTYNVGAGSFFRGIGTKRSPRSFNPGMNGGDWKDWQDKLPPIMNTDENPGRTPPGGSDDAIITGLPDDDKAKKHIDSGFDGKFCTCGSTQIHMRLESCGHLPCDKLNHDICTQCAKQLCSGSHGSNKCVFDCEFCGAKDVLPDVLSASHGAGVCDLFDCSACKVKGISNTLKDEHGSGICTFTCTLCGVKDVPNTRSGNHGSNKCVSDCALCGVTDIRSGQMKNHGVGHCGFTCSICSTTTSNANSGSHGLGQCGFTCALCGVTAVNAESGNHGIGQCAFTCADCGVTAVNAKKTDHGLNKCVFDCTICGEKGLSMADQSKHGMGICVIIASAFDCPDCGVKGIDESQKASHGKDKCIVKCDCDFCADRLSGVDHYVKATEFDAHADTCSACGYDICAECIIVGAHVVGTCTLCYQPTCPSNSVDHTEEQCTICLEFMCKTVLITHTASVEKCLDCGVDMCVATSSNHGFPKCVQECPRCSNTFTGADANLHFQQEVDGVDYWNMTCGDCGTPLCIGIYPDHHLIDENKCEACNAAMCQYGSHNVTRCEGCYDYICDKMKSEHVISMCPDCDSEMCSKHPEYHGEGICYFLCVVADTPHPLTGEYTKKCYNCELVGCEDHKPHGGISSESCPYCLDWWYVNCPSSAVEGLNAKHQGSVTCEICELVITNRCAFEKGHGDGKCNLTDGAEMYGMGKAIDRLPVNETNDIAEENVDEAVAEDDKKKPQKGKKNSGKNTGKAPKLKKR